MAFQRYLIEFGTGADLHGMDATKAAQKAVKDTLSHCCLCGIRDLLHIEDADKAMHLEIKIGCPVDDEIRLSEIASLIPFGSPDFTVEKGGLMIKGIREPKFGDGDNTMIVNAAITVWVDTDYIHMDVKTGD